MKICESCKKPILGKVHKNRKRCKECAALVANIQRRDSVKRWKVNNKDKVRKMSRDWEERFPVKKRLSHARNIARRRGLECSITDAQFIAFWEMPCHYCGSPNHNKAGTGLDRIDNHIGYTESNVVPCCEACNKMRNIFLTKEEMEVAMKAVLEYRKSHSEAK